MGVSIIFAYHNEGISFIMEAINGVKNTIDIDEFEIIIADDYSSKPLKLKEENVKVVRQKTHKGVGQAFDLGVKHAKYDNLFISGSDMRFAPNGWASKMLQEIHDHPKAITCNTFLNPIK